MVKRAFENAAIGTATFCLVTFRHVMRLLPSKQFLLKFTRDRRRNLYWLLEATKWFGLCVLDYTVTSNHVHLLLKSSDT